MIYIYPLSNKLFAVNVQTKFLKYIRKICSGAFNQYLNIIYTIYNPKSHETLCYLWNETGADLSSNNYNKFIIPLSGYQ